ncbi:MAG: putative lipid II flippase FtsW [Deltaproteobacteria bacterium]|nr:putative lipid II flippase FtsW [Deltaproteobacteria bacterium]
MAEAMALEQRTPDTSWRVADPWLLFAALALAGFGLVMVYSASSALAAKRYADATYFFRHQLLHVSTGLVVMFVLAYWDYTRLQRLAYPAMGVVLFLLVLVLIPGVGHTAGGASRWIRLGPWGLQPSELAKLALVLYLAYSLSEHRDNIKSFTMGVLPHLITTVVLVLPVLCQPDLGMTVMLVTLTLAMLFVAGARLSYLVGMLAVAAPAVWALVVFFPYRFKRLTVFWDPWADPRGAGFQIIHSFLALGSGGLWGVGLGSGRQKLFYLPEPHTDFVFSVLGEELGLMGVLVVLSLFLVVIWRGILTALEARDLFGTYLAVGCTLIVGLQAFVNAGVVMGLLPTKGLTLPFLSYGGSSLLTNFACVGILLAVARQKGKKA